MKTKLKLFQARMFCAVALGIGSSFSLAAAAADSADPAPAKTSIPWSQIGAKAGADYLQSRGVIGWRKTPWTGDTTNQALGA